MDDPSYQPVHVPVAGRIPDVVARWGAASQVRWFRRFRQELYEQVQALPVHERLALPQDSHEYFIDSVHHRGPCCSSCFDEWGYGTGVMVDGWCCCRDERSGR